MTLAPGTRIGVYEVERLLGAGGMGEVYLATDTRLHRPVALKVLPADLAADADPSTSSGSSRAQPRDDRRVRFEREARMAAALRHPHICTIHEVGEADGRAFIAMEFVEGTTLQDRVRVDLFSVKESVDIAIQIADALDEARQRGVVHRDLKSANIMLTPRGDVKVLDFGLAKQVDDLRAAEATTAAGLTGAGVVIGTAAYMSPEQALGQPLDHRSDLFSFGVVLYELLTGRVPFTGKTSMELFSAILHSTPAPIPRFNEAVPDPLVRVVGKLLEKDREKRYQSAREVVTDLRKIREEGATASVTQAARHPRWLLWGAVGTTVVAGVIAAMVWFGGPSPDLADSVVVLPAQVSGPADSEFLGDAVAVALSDRLFQVEGLDTKAPPTSLEVQRVNDEQQVVRAFGAARYVTSNVFAQGHEIRLFVRLVRSRDRSVVWSHEYVGTRERYLLLIQEAADGVRQELRPGVASGSQPQTTTSSAELAYQRGRFFWNRYNNGHEEADFIAAKASLEQALRDDPKLANAAATLAFLHLFKLEGPTGSKATFDEAESWAQKAIQIDARCGLGWAARSGVISRRPDVNPYEAMMKALPLALKGATLAPGDGLVANVAAAGDSFTFRLASARAAVRLDPLYLYGHANLAQTLAALDRSQEALAHLDAVLARDPSAAFVLRGPRIDVLADLGRTAEALVLLAELRRDVDAGKQPEWYFRLRELLIMVARGDSLVEARLREFLKLPIAEVYVHEHLLALYGKHGNREAAFRLLETGARGTGYANFDFLRADKRIDSLREDPRFTTHLARSRARFAELVAVLDAAKAAGELPKYLEDALHQMHALLAK